MGNPIGLSRTHLPYNAKVAAAPLLSSCHLLVNDATAGSHLLEMRKRDRMSFRKIEELHLHRTPATLCRRLTIRSIP